MRNCRKLSENLSVANAWEIAEKYQKICQWVMHQKLPKGIRKVVNGYCMRNRGKVLENLSRGTA